MEHSKIKNIIIGILAVLLLAAVGFIAWYSTRPAAPELERSVVSLAPTPTGQQAPDGIQIPGYPQLAADSATGVVSVMFQNPEGNPCYFQIDLVLQDTGETIYKSGLLEPGTGIENPKLGTIPYPGVYSAVIVYNTRSLTDNSPMNGASIQTELTVQ